MKNMTPVWELKVIVICLFLLVVAGAYNLYLANVSGSTAGGDQLGIQLASQKNGTNFLLLDAPKEKTKPPQKKPIVTPADQGQSKTITSEPKTVQKVQVDSTEKITPNETAPKDDRSRVILGLVLEPVSGD